MSRTDQPRVYDGYTILRHSQAQSAGETVVSISVTLPDGSRHELEGSSTKGNPVAALTRAARQMTAWVNAQPTGRGWRDG